MADECGERFAGQHRRIVTDKLVTDKRRFDDAGCKAAAQWLAEPPRAPRRMTSRHHVAVRAGPRD